MLPAHMGVMLRVGHASVFALLGFAVVAGCSARDELADASPDLDVGDVAIAKQLESPPYLYEGPMPALEAPSLVTSITGHTIRVTGLLPAGFDPETLPWYALRSKGDDGRVKVSVVYPTATGKKVGGKWNNVPGHYDHLNVRPYRPKDPDQTGKEHWGGFPFLNYHDARRFALHGPIDFTNDADLNGDGTRDADWRLVRGRVSLGCQRMQGEHVLELTHMLGFDMRHPHSTKENVPDPRNGVEGVYYPISLDVLAEPALDTLRLDELGPAGLRALSNATPDSPVALDVAYPKDATVASIPFATTSFVAPTWDANEMRAWACPVLPRDNPNLDRRVERQGGRFDGRYCERTRGTNMKDPRTGS